MSLQLHHRDGEVRSGNDPEWREGLRSTRWGASLKGGKLPALTNPEMNPASTARSVLLWVALAVITFALIIAGYGVGLWHLGTPGA